jgi:hypothetical protein
MSINNERPTRLEVNCTTGEEKLVELTDEEIAQLETEKLVYEQNEEARQVAAEAKAVAKASAEAKLAALGLTAEEIAAL